MRTDIISDYEPGQTVEYNGEISTVVGIHRADQQYFDKDGDPFWTHEYMLQTPNGKRVAINTEMRLRIPIDDLKVGDPVIIHVHHNFGRKMTRLFTLVTKITKTHITVKNGETKFRRKDGKRVGEKSFSETNMVLLGYNENEHIILRQNSRKAKMIKAIKETKLENVPDHTLRIIVDNLHPNYLKDGVLNEYKEE